MGLISYTTLVPAAMTLARAQIMQRIARTIAREQIISGKPDCLSMVLPQSSTQNRLRGHGNHWTLAMGRIYQVVPNAGTRTQLRYFLPMGRCMLCGERAYSVIVRQNHASRQRQHRRGIRPTRGIHQICF